jgi:hypothetical protein
VAGGAVIAKVGWWVVMLGLVLGLYSIIVWLFCL